MSPARTRTKSPAAAVSTSQALATHALASRAWVSMVLSLATLVALLAILRHAESLPALW